MKLTHDDVVGDVQKSLHDWVKEAYKQAIKEGIDANTIVLNKNFIKTNGFTFFISNHFWHDLPPMICGLEIRVADDLPEKVDFALIKANMTEREKLVKQTVLDTVQTIWNQLKAKAFPEDGCGEDCVHVSDIDQVLNEVLKNI